MRKLAESTALVVYRPPFDPEALVRVKNAVEHVAEAIVKLAEALSKALETVTVDAGAMIGCLLENMLCFVATPKEWHLMHHAKKWRTRKKYRNRLIRRLAGTAPEA